MVFMDVSTKGTIWSIFDRALGRRGRSRSVRAMVLDDHDQSSYLRSWRMSRV